MAIGMLKKTLKNYKFLVKFGRWPCALIIFMVGLGVGLRQFVVGPDGKRLSHHTKFSSVQLWFMVFFLCLLGVLVVFAMQLVISRLKKKKWTKTESVVKCLAKTVLGVAFYFLSMYLGACIVEDSKSFLSLVIMTWSVLLSLLLASYPDDFGFSDCFVAANLAMAIKFRSRIPVLICPGDAGDEESKWVWEWKHLLVRFAVGVGPVAMKLFVSDYLESWLTLAQADNIAEKTVASACDDNPSAPGVTMVVTPAHGTLTGA